MMTSFRETSVKVLLVLASLWTLQSCAQVSTRSRSADVELPPKTEAAATGAQEVSAEAGSPESFTPEAPEEPGEPLPPESPEEPVPGPYLTPEAPEEPGQPLMPETPEEPEPEPYLTPETPQEPEPGQPLMPETPEEPEPQPYLTPETPQEPEPGQTLTPETPQEPEQSQPLMPESPEEPEPGPYLTPETPQGSEPFAAVTDKRASTAGHPAKSERSAYVHLVRWKGETLSLIAQWYTGSWQNWKVLQRANPGTDPAGITIGDRIRVPERVLKRRDPLPFDFLSPPRPRTRPTRTRGEPTATDANVDLFGPVTAAAHKDEPAQEELDPFEPAEITGKPAEAQGQTGLFGPIE